MLELNKIHYGHVLGLLKRFPDESIYCVVTSPPYWALRDYRTEPQIWDGEPNCKHDWGNAKPTLAHKKKKNLRKTQNKAAGKKGTTHTKKNDDKTSAFCLRCDAWKGELGLEPTFELYLKHLCNVFDEVKRVLKNTGTLWVNMGDRYGGSGGTSGHMKDTMNIGYRTLEMGATKGIAQHYMPKCLVQIPSRFAIEMCNPKWVLREDLTQEEKQYVFRELIERGLL